MKKDRKKIEVKLPVGLVVRQVKVFHDISYGNGGRTRYAGQTMHQHTATRLSYFVCKSKYSYCILLNILHVLTWEGILLNILHVLTWEGILLNILHALTWEAILLSPKHILRSNVSMFVRIQLHFMLSLRLLILLYTIRQFVTIM